jgi:hypothetical protein
VGEAAVRVYASSRAQSCPRFPSCRDRVTATPSGKNRETRGREWSIAAVIPTYNRATLIERAIESALTQQRQPDEVLVVDDGSTDNTAALVAAYGEPVTLIRKPQGGVSTARNLGVARSRSDYVAFLDSDDLWYPSHLLRMEQAIEATNGRAVLYFSDLQLGPHYPTDTAWEPCGFEIEGTHKLCDDAGDWLFGPRQPMLIPASLVRRDAYLAVGGSESRLICRGDTHLFFKIGMAGPLCAVAGFAGHATRHDPTSVQTTAGPGAETYLNCTVWLYGDLLRSGKFTGAQRGVLSRRLGDGYWDLAKHQGARAPASALLSLARATRHDPALLPKRLSNRIRRIELGIPRRSTNASVE